MQKLCILTSSFFVLWIIIVNLSFRFNGHEPGLADVYWSKGWWSWWVVTTGLLELWVVQSSSQTNIQFFLQARCPSVAQPKFSVKALKGTLHGLAYPKLTWGFSYCLWPPIAPGYLAGGLPCLSSALWCQYPITTEFSITEISQITRARKCAKAMYIKFKFLHIVNNYYE